MKRRMIALLALVYILTGCTAAPDGAGKEEASGSGPASGQAVTTAHSGGSQAAG